MSNVIELQQLKKDLEPICETLETYRLRYYKQARNAQILLVLLVLVFLASLVLTFIYINSFYYIFMVAGGLSVVLFALVYNKMYLVPIKTYHSKFKSMFVQRAVEELKPDMEYRPAGFISQKIFEKSGLFEKPNVTYEGEDYFEGQINGIPIKFSEIHAARLVGKNTTPLFQGLFFVADVPTSFQGKTILLPNMEDSLVGTAWSDKIHEHYAEVKGQELIHLDDDTDFEHYFVTYSTKPEETKKILCKEMLDSIQALRKSFGSDIYISFQDEEGFVYIAVAMPSILNPDIQQSVTANHEVFYQMYAQLQTSFEVIESLPLGFQYLKD